MAFPPQATKDLLDLEKALKEVKTWRSEHAMDFFSPYPKQLEFFTLGATFSERLLMAGNRVGKSEAGAYETACHLTGDYPEWWAGRRFTQPTVGWMAGETSLVVRDVQQRKLCGMPGVDENFGQGMIPREKFVDKPSLARGVSDAYDTIQVRHTSGGVSVGRFKSYEQGRAKFQGEALDFFWNDEEPDLDIYAEILTRIGDRNGMGFTTFTPLLGRSKMVQRFTDETHPSRAMVGMTLEDAFHFTAAQRELIISRYPAYQREARARGIPLLGSGGIYITPESMVVEPQIEEIPKTWAKIWGIDFGIDNPFGAVLALWDRDNDVIHIHEAFKIANGVPVMHAKAMKHIAAAVPIAWPHDGNNREKGSGVPLAGFYRKEGLYMLEKHSTFPEGGLSPEAGVADIDQREKTGRWKIASHLSEFLHERRHYHRKDGNIVAVDNHLLDAARMCLMMLRFAKVVPLGSEGGPRRARVGEAFMATGLDFDPF